MRAVREILKRPDPTQDLDERHRQRLRDSLFSLEEAQRPNKYMNAQRSKEKRQRARDTIREILDQQVRMISEALNPTPIPQAPAPEPTTPSTRPASAYYGRATKKLVDQALSTEPTGFDPKRSGVDLPTKGDLREMLSQEQRLKRAKEDLRSTGAPNFLGQKNPEQDIMDALDRYLHGPYVELEQGRIREMERGLKIALRDSKGEELEQVKDETARFWREWGGEYKRLQDEFARGRTEGEALRNIRAFIPKRALTPEINQLLDQMERELDQRPVTGHDVALWIKTRDTNKATRDRQPTTPREQLTETAREVTQGADNFETMPEAEAPKSSAREQLIETAEQVTAPSSPLDIDQANAQDTLTENRTRAPESKAADKALIETARELAKTSERGEEIKSALVDLMNAQQLKRYKRATGDMSARAEDMIEKRREARERLRSATSGEVINNFETMPETEAQPKRRPSIYTRADMVSYSKVDSIMDGKTPSRLPLKTQAQFEKIEGLIAELEQMEQQRTKSGRLKDWQGIKAKREEILNARRVLLQKYASERTRTQHSALQDHTFLSYYKPAKSTATPEEVSDKHGDRRSDLRTLRRYFETHEPDQQGQLTEAAETLDTRSAQQKTFTPEIQSAISSFKVDVGRRQPKSYPLETYLKTRKDGGIYRTSKTPEQLANLIAGNLPDNLANLYDFGEDTLRALITRAINEGVEARETPAELKDRIGSVITKRAQDSAASQKAQITGEGQSKALREMRRNIMTLSGDGYFDEYGRGGERSYMGLGAIEKTLNISERLNDLYVDAIFREALPPELERFKAPISRFGTKAADQVAIAFANKYETVGEIRDNISTIREQMRATIESAIHKTSNALAGNPYTLRLINQSYEKATERLNTDRQENIENARAFAQYADDPQAHLAEIQELERQSDQAIAEQMEINREFANAYIHEASDLVERALETTKGEVIDNVMSVKTPKHAGKFTASVQGKANRKLIARIFNEVFEQVRREIQDEPIERGEKHPRNIADTVKKPSKTPAQFRGDIERADEEKRARKRAEREARRARRVQKSARPLITYRAQLIQTVERLTAA